MLIRAVARLSSITTVSSSILIVVGSRRACSVLRIKSEQSSPMVRSSRTPVSGMDNAW